METLALTDAFPVERCHAASQANKGSGLWQPPPPLEWKVGGTMAGGGASKRDELISLLRQN